MSDYTPEQWRQIFANAKAALQKDRTNARALAAFRAALPTIAADRDATRRAEYLKDVDPGWLASLGLGAADMMSFGLGKQVAAALDRAAPESDRSYAALTETAAQAQHPIAHLTGEGIGLVGPAAAEYGLAKAGALVPTGIGRAVRTITGRPARIAARTVLNATEGAGLAAGQAAGRTEGSLRDRAQAAGQAAPYGAIAGAVLPAVVGAIPTIINRGIVRPTQAAGRAMNEILDRIAGKAMPRSVPMKFDLVPPGEGLLAPSAPRAPGPAVGPPSMRTVTPDPLDVPTFQRPGLLKAEGPLPEAWQVPARPAGGVGGHSYSGTYPRTLPIANAAKAQAALRGMSIADLQRAWSAPQVPKALRALIEAEFQRRMVTLPSGLLAAPIP